MNRHLSDQEIAAEVAGLELEADRARHLDGCVVCRRKVETFLKTVDARREVLQAEAPDWESQRRRIMEQVGAPAASVVVLRRRRLWRPLLAAAAALMAAVGIWLQTTDRRPAVSARNLPVEQILSDVDATLADESVPGFESLDSLIPSPDEMVSMVDERNTAS